MPESVGLGRRMDTLPRANLEATGRVGRPQTTAHHDGDGRTDDLDDNTRGVYTAEYGWMETGQGSEVITLFVQERGALRFDFQSVYYHVSWME